MQTNSSIWISHILVCYRNTSGMYGRRKLVLHIASISRNAKVFTSLMYGFVVYRSRNRRDVWVCIRHRTSADPIMSEVHSHLCTCMCECELRHLCASSSRIQKTHSIVCDMSVRLESLL